MNEVKGLFLIMGCINTFIGVQIMLICVIANVNQLKCLCYGALSFAVGLSCLFVYHKYFNVS